MSKIEGIDDLLNQFHKMGNMDAALEKSVRKWTEYVRGEAADLCPVRTGELRRSIHTDVQHNGDSIDGIIYTNKEYAPHVELGTSKQKAQPYLFPALNNNKDKVTKGIQDDMAKAIKGAVRS